MGMPGATVEIALAADPAIVDELVALFTTEGIEEFWEDGSLLRAYLPAAHWGPALHDRLQQIAAGVASAHGARRPELSIREIPPRDWNEQWQRSIQPIAATDRIVITPSWNTPPLPAGDIILTIDPKMSFGTGHHETTRLMLRLIESYVRPGMRVLDLGTGTGVLAIAAVRLGAASAVGVDIDAWSIVNAAENVRTNHVEDQVTLMQGDLAAVAAGPVFDLIAANIQRNVLEPLFGAFRSRLTDAGVLLLSGLLAQDRGPVVRSAEDQHLRVLGEIAERDWIALAMGAE